MALIRCEKCGNPVSSKSKACPICGAPVAKEDATPQNTTTEPTADSGPKTLNDIIAERNAQRTLNDAHTTTEDVQAEAKPTINIYAEPQSEGTTYADNAHIDDLEDEIERNTRSIKGLKTMLLFAVILLVPAAYFSISYVVKYSSIKEDYAIVESARQLFEEQNALLQRDAESLVSELKELKDRNDTMMAKYQEAVTMLEQLQREKTYNYNQLAKYKKEVETLRGVMKGYLRQIDSLNTINSNLQAQNVAYQKEISTAQLRADVAEERADELGTKVRIGSVIRASGIRIVALNDNSKEVRRIKQAARLRVDLELTANELGINKEDVVVASTGVIGQPLDITPIKNGLPALKEALGDNNSEYAAEGIMTTDVAKKEIAVSFTIGGKECRIGGIAKGSGMIHPNMATMLVFVTTDAAISPEMLQKALSKDIQSTFNMVSVDGEPVDLSVKEFELLMYFVENPRIALSREKILNNVWNYDYFGDARTIDTHVKKLRSKLGSKGDLIKTIWGMGYKFEVDE